MNLKILTGLLVLGVSALCDKPKPDPFAGKKNLIKAEGKTCGFFTSAEANGSALQLTGVELHKDFIPIIWSGGFVVKPAQRAGMVIETEAGEVYENVWVEYMDPYSEGQNSITIARMECLVENQEEQPGQESDQQGLLSNKINIMCNGVVIGQIQSLDVTMPNQPSYLPVDIKHPSFSGGRARFDRLRMTEAFTRGDLHYQTQFVPLQIEVVRNNKAVSRLHNCWINNLELQSDSKGDYVIADIKGHCKKIDFDLSFSKNSSPP